MAAILAFLLILALIIILFPIPYTIKATFGGSINERKISVRLFGIPLPVSYFMNRGKRKKDYKKNSSVEKDNKEPVADKKSVKEPIINEKPVKNLSEKKSRMKGHFFKRKGVARGKAESISDKIKKLTGFIKEKDNIEIVVKTLKHIRPRKIKAEMIIGLPDPSNTGLLFGGLGILMVIWPGRYRLRPDFEKEIVKGNITVKGIASLILLSIYIFKLFKALNSKKEKKRSVTNGSK